MVVGYGRVSTNDQSLDLQTDALTAAGCGRLFIEKVSGKLEQRPELDKMLAILKPGDTVVVWKLDRLSRVLKHNLTLLELFKNRKVNLRILDLGVDTSTPLGLFFFQLVGAFAELTRNAIVENTNSGLAAARARGRVGGRPKGLSPKAKEKAQTAAILYKTNAMPVSSILRQLGIGKATFYRYLDAMGVDITKKNENK